MSRRAMIAVAALLVVVGVLSSVGRAVFVEDLITRADPARTWIIQRAGIRDPRAESRAEILRQVDGRYAQNPRVARFHVIGGAAYLLFGLLQFSSRVRRRNIRYHRWAGRALVATGLAMAIAGLYFGIRFPYAGLAEIIPVTTFGALFVFALGRGFVAIRRRDIARHRVWMTRAFAIGAGISVVRLVAPGADFVFTPIGWTPGEIFVLSLWSGWGVSIVAAELWLRRGRPGLVPSLSQPTLVSG
jgi:uncharacterized membrane protein